MAQLAAPDLGPETTGSLVVRQLAAGSLGLIKLRIVELKERLNCAVHCIEF